MYAVRQAENFDAKRLNTDGSRAVCDTPAPPRKNPRNQ